MKELWTRYEEERQKNEEKMNMSSTVATMVMVNNTDIFIDMKTKKQ